MRRGLVPLVTLLFLGSHALLAGRIAEARKPPKPAAAPRESAEQEVERLANEAVEEYKAANYERAVKLLTRAYAIRPVPALLYNLARAAEKAGQVVPAYEGYQKYVSSEDTDPKLSAKAQERMASLEPQYRAATAPKVVEPPKVETPKEPPKTIIVERTGPSPAELAAAAAAEERDRRERGRKLKLGIGGGLAGLGVVALGVGLGTYVAASGKQSDFAASRDEVVKRNLRDSSQSLGLISTVMYISGGLLFAGGAALFYLGLRERVPESPPAPSSGRVSLAPSLVPWIAPTGAGGVASWRF